MRDMKYVMNREKGIFLLIPDIGMNHSDVPGNWTSAGFVSFNTDEKDEYGITIVKPRCHGKSVTLGLSSHPDDTRFMEISMKDRW